MKERPEQRRRDSTEPSSALSLSLDTSKLLWAKGKREKQSRPMAPWTAYLNVYVCVCACQWQKSCQRAAVLSAGGCRRWQRCGLNDNDDRGAATEAISFLLSLLKSLVYFLFSNSISCRPIFATLIRLPNQRPKRPLLSV